jgi:hypothetical protein
MQDAQANHADLTEDSLVAALVSDARRVPDMVVLHGYLGKGQDEGIWCLYLTMELNERVEFHQDAILHSLSLSDNRGTLVWVRRTTPVQYVQVHTEEVPADLVMPGALRRPRSARLGPGTVEAGAIPFALATPHHAPRPGPFPPLPKYGPVKLREDRYRPGPYGFVWGDEPEADDPIRGQLQRAVEDYAALYAAYEVLRSSRGWGIP